jgi:hypothetical protein
MFMPRTAQATASAAVSKRLLNRPKIERARRLWGDSDWTVDDIAAAVGLSRRTLYYALGPRWVVDEAKLIS